jgi:alkylated DNA repair dioxygenase AlkB
MPQLSLFRGEESVIVDDASGRIAYVPRFVAPATAAEWFAELREKAGWEAKRRWMYDREVDVPRLTAHYTLPPEAEAPAAIRESAERVIAATGVAFNGVGLNLYRDGRDSVAAHNDHLYEIVEGYPIVLLSLGATRRMSIRAKERGARAMNVDLDDSSLLIMSYDTQLNYTHGVPKTTKPVGERISLAFRVRPASRAEGGRALYS